MTVKVIRATTLPGLDEIVGLVHDHWFSLSELRHDKLESLITITLSADASPRSGPGYELEVRCVSAMIVEDSERVDRYDLNRLVYDEGRTQLSVTTGIPLVLKILVSGVDVTLRALEP